MWWSVTSHVIHFVLLGVEVPARVTSQTISEESALVFSNPSANYIKIYMYVCKYIYMYACMYVTYVCTYTIPHTYINTLYV